MAKQNPRATLDEFCQRVRERCDVSVSLATMSLTLQRLGLAKGQGKPLFDESALKQLGRLARKNPEATVKELGEAVRRQSGIKASRSTLYAAVKRLGLNGKGVALVRTEDTAPPSTGDHARTQCLIASARNTKTENLKN